MKFLKTFSVLVIITIYGCSSFTKKVETQDGPPLDNNVNIDEIKEPIPWNEPKSPGGNPESYVIFGKRYWILKDNKGFRQSGIASWYGRKFHGRKTSNGEVFDMFGMTAAHKTLPLPTFLRVTNIENNRSVIVRVNDRGPFHENRIVDLSYAAAVKLDIHTKGTGLVEIVAVFDNSNEIPFGEVKAKSNSRQVYVQIGAFTDKRNAIKLQNSVIQPEFPAPRIFVGTHENKPVFRVQIGPISSISDADQLTRQLGRQGINSRFVFEGNVPEHHVVQCC